MMLLVLFLINLTDWRGGAVLPFLLLGGVALLVLVRSTVTTQSMRQRVVSLAQQTEEIAQALTIERDTIASIVTYSGDGIFTVDKSLRIRHFNPALAAITGLREEDVVGRPAGDVLGPHHAPTVIGEALRRAMREGGAVRIDSTLQSDEGSRALTTSYTAIPGPGGALALGVGVVRDLTAEKEEVRTREDYFSLVTHDLRNPLTAIIGNTHLLSKELAPLGEDVATARRLVTRIEKANDQLLRLVNNLLELQRIQTGRALLRAQPVALGPLVEELADEFRATALERGQTISLSGPPLRAWVDPVWCRQILANLVSNAVKYTPHGGTIDVALEARGGQVAISVTDTGYGLSPEELEKLFTTFFRSKRQEIRAASGTGLGLALAKRMAERMGGDIVVRSSVGVGSTFTVLLPLGDLPPFVERHDDDRAMPEHIAMPGERDDHDRAAPEPIAGVPF